MNWRVSGACLVAMAFAASAALGTLSSPTAAEVDRLRATFTNEIAKYDKVLEAGVCEVRDQYAVALVTLERKFTAAGTLDPVLSTRKEFSRFASARSLRAEDLVAEPAELHALQQQYIRKFEALPAERAAKVVRLAELYGKSLRALEESLTKQRMIDDAVEVKKIREGIPSLSAVAGASLIVSTLPQAATDSTNSAAAENKTPPPPPVPAVAPAPTNAPARPDRKVAKKYTGSSSSRIREQFEVFWKAIQRQNWTAAEQIIDPATVKAHGSERVKGFIRGYGGPFGGENPNLRVELRNLDVDSDDRTASGTPRVWVQVDWREMRPLRWVQTEGDWYIDVQATMSERREARREERRDERGGRGSR